MEGGKLLIVEDSEPVAQLLTASLGGQFAEIRSAGTVAAAKRCFRLHDGAPFDFVICSLTLPDGTGTEFKQWLDEHLTPRRVPFVLIAGSLPGLRRTQADVVLLPKPFQMDDLIGALTEARNQSERRGLRSKIQEDTPPYAPEFPA